jgi:CHAT domain-containing protein
LKRTSLCALLICVAGPLSAGSPAQQPTAASKPDVAMPEPAKAASDPVAQAREELRAAEAAHPGNTAEVAGALHNLAKVEVDEMQAGAETLELAQRELAVAEAANGSDSKAHVNALADYAEVLTVLSRGAEGRPLAEHAFEIAQKGFGDSDEGIHTADVLTLVCNVLGDFPCALRAAEAAIAAERKPGPEHDWMLASTLSMLGDVKERMGDTAGAGAAIEEALADAIRTRPNDPQVGILESNVGAYHLRKQEFPEAIPHLNRALALFNGAYGPNNLFARVTLANVADIYSRTGQFPLAWKDYELAVGNESETVDTVARLRANYARSLAAGGDLRHAVEQGLNSSRMSRETFVLQARTLPERQALVYAQQRPQGLDVALSVLTRHSELPSSGIYQEVVRSRALVADEMARRQKNLNAANDPEIARLLQDLNQARADLLSAGGAAQGKKENAEALAQGTVKMERIEGALAQRSVGLRNDERTNAVDINDVRHGLPAQSVLVSYVAYQRCAVEAVDQARINTPSYMAFVLHPDSDRTRVFDLGDAASLDELVRKARAAADAEAHSGGMGSMRNEWAYREAGEALRERIWDPLKKEVGDAKLALVVADGNLNLVPFASLPDGKGYLVEHGPVIHMLSSERDLVPAAESKRKLGLLAMGSPSFQLALNQLPASPLRGASPSCEEFGKIEFQPLPGTALEVSDIGNTWRRWNGVEPAQLVTGDDATLTRFLDESSHSRVLHVATHAFLLDKSCGNGNPLLHSGLVFAGGQHGAAQSILTAQQIASLDLSGVDWAVLSACNTGNGELRDGEGVLGLQRAFHVAGAHSVIMTLWPVDDDLARQFMHLLYTERLGQHATTADAVWSSSRKLLLKRRAKGLSTHPWYWAGFVGTGGWE